MHVAEYESVTPVESTYVAPLPEVEMSMTPSVMVKSPSVEMPLPASPVEVTWSSPPLMTKALSVLKAVQ